MQERLRRVSWCLRNLNRRMFTVPLLALALALTIYVIAQMTRVVYIYDGNQSTLTYTTKNDVHEILNNQGYYLMAADEVDYTDFAQKYVEINITRAFPVQVKADGEKRTIMTTGGTVAQVLLQSGIEFDADDRISSPLDATVSSGLEIVVTRVEYETYTEVQTIPFEQEVQYTSLLSNGKTVITQNGSNGEQVLTYRRRLENGVPQEPELVDTTVTVQPVNQQALVGANVAISPLDFGVELDANGQPVHYSRVLTNQRATGYTAKAGAYTASGRKAGVGYVAVNPNVIPYGSKLYIVSADNRFIYGCAIAADTGTALMSGHAGVDLYYATYLESCLNGAKYVNIYVLE